MKSKKNALSVSVPTNRRTVAVLGCGVIGLSWVKAFLEYGHAVRVWDPRPDIAKHLQDQCGAFLGKTLVVYRDPEEAVLGADFIQESGPEDLALKHALYSRIEETIGADCILASSTSTLKPSQLQKGSRFAERIVVGHPFNPPHLLPLVEVVGGVSSSTESIDRAIRFYTSIGKKPINLRTERLGHLANRLQAALWREAVDAVASGQANVEDVDLAVTAALGPRWAVVGPFTTFHLGGGPGGLEHFLEHLGGAFEALWDDANRPVVTDALSQKLIADVKKALTDYTSTELTAERDNKLSAILSILQT